MRREPFRESALIWSGSKRLLAFDAEAARAFRRAHKEELCMEIASRHRSNIVIALVATSLGLFAGCLNYPNQVQTNAAGKSQRFPHVAFQHKIESNAERLFHDGKRIFRSDTFGSEEFWGDQLRLHEAILGEKRGGVGAGLTPKQALEVGLKVDVDKVPRILLEVLRGGHISLNKPATTVELIRANSVIGVRGEFKNGKLQRVGITCALCHSAVDDSFAKGIGRPLDGWPNRDLNVGEIVAMAPNLAPFTELLGKDADTVRKVLRSWGPGKYDAELDKDGKALKPDGTSAATVIPAAFGLAGQNLHTYTGWGSVPYWNAYVGITQMHGKGTFYDPRLNNAEQFPVSVRAKTFDIRPEKDLVTAKLPALHLYQLSIPAPKPSRNSYDHRAARRGAEIFGNKAHCAQCHVPPLFSEPGWPMHTPAEIGIDDFQANRSPDKRYRTTPLRGLFVREKGGFYHDGRFKSYDEVVNHYKPVLKFELTQEEQRDLVEYLKSL
jgi:mono/diheme cytochrome c family protein